LKEINFFLLFGKNFCQFLILRILELVVGFQKFEILGSLIGKFYHEKKEFS